MEPGVEFSVVDGVHIIRFARPEKKNALVSASYAAMTAALERADEAGDVSAHLFVGSNGVFTAGNDIGDFLESAKGAQGLSDPVIRFLHALPQVQKPMIAAVDGLAVGIGTTLMFHCDLVYAAPEASFRAPFVDLAVVPEAGSSLLGPRVMGHVRAFELLVLGAPFDGEAARQAGFVNAVVPADELEAVAMEAARKLARKPPEALAAARRLLRGDKADVAEAIDAEVAMFSERLKSPEAAEAFSAFLEKRPPDFGKLRRGD